MATLITASGKVEAITLRNGATFSADEIHELVGGYLECVRLRDGRIMWFDEEGKLKGKPPNMVATFIALDALARDDVIVGHAVITTLAEAGE
jgi:drug/metabolite transporter superfamily protein YnfA